MADKIKGQNAIKILRRKEIFKAFTDDDNPISTQITNGLYFLITEDKEKIRSQKSSKDAAVAIHEVLIKNYKDNAEISLEDFIEALENQRTNVKLSKMLRVACVGNAQSMTYQGEASAGAAAAEPIIGDRAVDILQSRPVATQFNLVYAADVASDLSPWFIRDADKEKIVNTARNQSNKLAANDLLGIIVDHFKQGRDDISLQDLIGTLKETKKYDKLITALVNACK